MKIIKPSFEVLSRDEQRGNIGVIEIAARTCYKTEDAIRDGSAETITAMLISRNHTAMLEHGDYIFMVDDYKILDNVAYCLHRHDKDTGHRIRLSITDAASRPIISGNVRAWRELMASHSMAAWYFSGAIDPIFIGDIVPRKNALRTAGSTGSPTAT